MKTENQLAKALLSAQMEMGHAVKDSSNPFFKSKYADLNSIREACMPALNKHGIVVLQPTCSIEGRNYVETILLHESGERMSCFTEIIYSRQNDAQSQGSGITYARRYGLQSFVNVGADDDDGNAASKIAIQPQAQSKPLFTEANFAAAKTAKATVEQIQLKYSMTEGIKAKYVEYMMQA